MLFRSEGELALVVLRETDEGLQDAAVGLGVSHNSSMARKLVVDDPVDKHESHGAEDCHDEAGGLTGPIKTGAFA